MSFDHLLSFINVMFYKLRIPRQSDEVKHFKQSDEGQSGKTQTRHTHTQHNTHTQHSHTENDTHTDTPRMTHTHKQTPQARFWTQTLRKGPSGVRRARRTNTPQARLWTQTLRQGPSGVSRDRRTNTRRGRRVRRSKAHLRLAKPVERQHRE